MSSFSIPSSPSRIGFHYYPDMAHYRDIDLLTWLPELRSLGASWLTLQAPSERAIPEFFISGVLAAGIEPVLHFQLSLKRPIDLQSIRLLFSAYARWGVHYVVLFDRPNLRRAWPAPAWAQADLVERFLDIYLPLADVALQEGLIPVFPPLEPGGDYWDTAFLRASLRGMRRRGQTRLLDSLVLGANAWAGSRPLNWGAGGPERWPGARPYHTPEGVQDQLGFRVFDWYLTIARAELGSPRPVLLLRAGSRPDDRSCPEDSPIDEISHAQRNLAIARLMSNDLPDPSGLLQAEVLDPVPADVLACNFWLLTAKEGPAASHSWFRADGENLPVVGAFRQWSAGSRSLNGSPASDSDKKATPIIRPAQDSPTRKDLSSMGENSTSTPGPRPITHYLLLPLYAWGVAEWDLDLVRPFIQKFHPTVGFSLDEAALASHVTLVGKPQTFPESAFNALRAAGCRVDRINEDGTVIAS